ncbi:hypothetical protein J1N35_016201 [Gossypium stocksii]|uniref:Aminotransferase-like plant mobile domain-containing protein n=1 Tax=Gossypium stocksii TaxID=47602 RepID=A0A9D3VXQ0_9ROSI|nr:hypothetical protein J1N35_016201 [Gossypium stocksii]
MPEAAPIELLAEAALKVEVPEVAPKMRRMHTGSFVFLYLGTIIRSPSSFSTPVKEGEEEKKRIREEEEGEGSTATLTRTFDLRYNLISALVEHWHPKTHTFHLPCREYTITLEDIALQLRLPTDESAVTGVSVIAEPAALCYSLLGVLPSDDESNFKGLKFIWLKANFEHLSVNAPEQELM